MSEIEWRGEFEELEASLAATRAERDTLAAQVAWQSMMLQSLAVELFDPEQMVAYAEQPALIVQAARNVNANEAHYRNKCAVLAAQVEQLTQERDEALKALIVAWRDAAGKADHLATAYEGGGDDAGNGHAFRKERRIWTTCADELEAALQPPAGRVPEEQAERYAVLILCDSKAERDARIASLQPETPQSILTAPTTSAVTRASGDLYQRHTPWCPKVGIGTACTCGADPEL